ncbi:uncharacterized protein METZ01_LOCUS364249, partial [marine metagenome]
MKKFNHVGSELQDLRTENIEGKRHYVTPDGNKYISITTLLSNLSKAGIQKWRERVGEVEANRISTKASRQGTRVHSICESYIKNEDGFLDGRMPNEVEMFQSINPLLDKIDNIHCVEGALYSDELKLAGRTDLIAEFNDELAVIDYKTSRKIKTWEMCHAYFMQGAFYAQAYEERTGISVNEIVIIMAVENE